jgi:hypothetical protein
VGWAFLAPLAILAAVVLLILPGPRAAVGSWMARIRLGRLDVVVAPEPTLRPVLAASIESYASVADAERAVGFHVLAPGYLPPGVELVGMQSVSYEQLPIWLQPLYVESIYRVEPGKPTQADARLRQFSARQTPDVEVGAIEYQSEDIRATRPLTLANGAAAVLLEFRQPDPPLRELIWEQDGMTFELWSAAWSEEDLIRVAESLR